MAKTNINHRAPIPRPISGPNKQKKSQNFVHIKAINVASVLIEQADFEQDLRSHTCSWRNHRSLVNKQWPRRPSGQAQRCPSHLRFVKEKLHEDFAEQLPGVREVQHSGAYTNCSILGPLAKCSWQMSWPTPSPSPRHSSLCIRKCAVISTSFVGQLFVRASLCRHPFGASFIEKPAPLDRHYMSGLGVGTHMDSIQGLLSALYWVVINVPCPPQSLFDWGVLSFFEKRIFLEEFVWLGKWFQI